VTAIGLAAAAALAWGTSDFCGGKAAQRSDARAVAVVSQLLALPSLVPCLVLLPGPAQIRDLALAATAGVAEFGAIVLLYRGLASGAMTVFAPITAATSAVVPMAIGLAADPVPGALALGGAACVVVAIPLISMTHNDRRTEAPSIVIARLVTLALAAGAMFGIYFSLLGQTTDSGIWPVVALKSATVALGLLVLARRGISVRLPQRVMALAAVAGAGDAVASVFYLLAARDGSLSIVAPVAALAPIGTVLLALAIDKERMRAVQIVGLGLAATALVLTAI